MSLITQHIYRSANGDHWSSMTNTSSGRKFVRHEANQSSGGHLTDTDVEDLFRSWWVRSGICRFAATDWADIGRFGIAAVPANNELGLSVRRLSSRVGF